MAGIDSAKDWLYVICTPIQTFLAIAGLFYVKFWYERRKADQQRRDEKREKETQREEDRQRADAEKIAAILSENYYEVENIFDGLKESVDKLCENKIVGDWTEFHVLLYMCRADNWEKFKYIKPNIYSVNEHQDPRYELLSHVETIMKFFLKFRINLFSIMQNKACPEDIKLEFSRKITEMGKTIYPFVEGKHRQDVIKRVLNYFISATTEQEHATLPTSGAITSRTHPNPQDQSTERLVVPQSTSIEVTNPNQGPELMRYPGNSAIERAIPYLECFSYESYQENTMRLHFLNQIPIIGRLMEIPHKEDEILNKIDELWQGNEQGPPPGRELLHSVRMIMFQLTVDRQFFPQDSLDSLKTYIRGIIPFDNLSNNAKECEFKRLLDDINRITNDLKSHNMVKSLLVLEEANHKLERVAHALTELAKEAHSRHGQSRHSQQQPQLQQQQC